MTGMFVTDLRTAFTSTMVVTSPMCPPDSLPSAITPSAPAFSNKKCLVCRTNQRQYFDAFFFEGFHETGRIIMLSLTFSSVLKDLENNFRDVTWECLTVMFLLEYPILLDDIHCDSVSIIISFILFSTYY